MDVSILSQHDSPYHPHTNVSTVSNQDLQYISTTQKKYIFAYPLTLRSN